MSITAVETKPGLPKVRPCVVVVGGSAHGSEARLGLQYSTDRLSLGGLARIVSAQERYALNQGNIVGQDLGPTPGFAVFSLNGRARVHRLASVSMGVDNVFDKTYAEFISRNGAAVTGFPTTTRVNEPGRTLWVKLDFRY